MGTPQVTEPDGERIERKTRGLWDHESKRLPKKVVSLVSNVMDRHYRVLRGYC